MEKWLLAHVLLALSAIELIATGDKHTRSGF